MNHNHTPRPSRKYDVAVVGARCAGAATARLLAARGLDVLLVDRAVFPSDTLSTHGLARGGVVQLAKWGLLDRVLASGAPPVREVAFHLDGEATHRHVKDRAGVDLLVAPRRHQLDQILLESAREAGVETMLNATVIDVRRTGERVTGIVVRTGTGIREIAARHVVGADGVRSTTAELFGAQTTVSFDADVSLFYAYVGGVDWHGYEFHLAPDAFAGVFPTHDGQACVWLSRPTSRLRSVRRAGPKRKAAWASALEEVSPDLGRRVRSGEVGSPVRGCIAPPNYVRRAAGPGWSLVGDAGYHRDPITGHGITDAFRDAELVAEALDEALADSSDDRTALAAYETSRNTALAETFRLTEQLARFPAPQRFAELQRELAEALEHEALWLASRPARVGRHAASVA